MMLITLDEAKAQLGMEADESEDDVLLEGFIAAAALHFASRGIIVDQEEERSWIFDSFLNLMVIPDVPIDAETVAISYLDGNGDSQTFEDFRCVQLGKHIRLLPAIGSTWPTTACAPGVITVTATAGYNEDPDASDSVPADLKVAARMLISYWHLNREAFASGLAEVPMGVSALLSPYRLGWL